MTVRHERGGAARSGDGRETAGKTQPSDRDLRADLVAAAARLLSTTGPGGLTTRRVAAAVGVSTTAVYTRFGSLDALRRAVRADGFERLERRLIGPVTTADPVADLAAVAGAYVDFAVAEPHLYRVMVTERPPPPGQIGDPDPGEEAFRHLQGLVLRCVERGRYSAGDSTTTLLWTAQLWAALHGIATLALAGTVPPDQVRAVLADLVVRLSIGYGDAPDAAHASVARSTSSPRHGGPAIGSEGPGHGSGD